MTKIILPVFLSVLLAQVAFAQSIMDRFDQIDRNKDGIVTKEEVRGAAWFDRLLKRLDRNRDGKLQKNEVARQANRSSTKDRSSIPKAPAHKKYTLQYHKIEGVDENLLSIDLYVPSKDSKEARPTMIMIHGGGWRGGDKSNTAAKMAHFLNHGYLYASINYRLSSQLPGAEDVRHPIHVEDCARALAWIHDNISKYNGDPKQLHLMGHSAGAHLAGLLGTNDRFLKALGKDLSIIKTNVLLDTAAINIPGYLDDVGPSGMSKLYANAFGTRKETLIDASPFHHVDAGKSIPPTILFYGGDRMGLHKFAPQFAKAMTKAGAPSQAIDTVDLDHGQINFNVGMPNDEMTKLIMKLHAGQDASQFPTVLLGKNKGNEKSSVSDSGQSIQFSVDYVAGTQDVNGQFMGGTETMRIVAHEGKLFAALSYWTDQPGDDPSPGAQILVKNGPNSNWQLDKSFPGVGRISAMESITFTRGINGDKLREPVTLLVADAAPISNHRRTGMLTCSIRKNDSEQWSKSLICKSAERGFIRAFGFHKDNSGNEFLFAGTGAGEIYSGQFDSKLGTIVWKSTPEYKNPDFDGGAYRRCQGFCVANGRLYASVAPRLLERQDNASAEWREVFKWTPQDRAGAGLRGITAIPSLKGDHQVILGSREQEGRILRIDPLNEYQVTDELDSRDFLQKEIEGFRGGKLVAYNRFIPGKHPATQKPIHWVTVAGGLRSDKAAWLMIRNSDATYEVLRVFDENSPANNRLISTRTLEFAPWNSNEFYTGGYDGAANKRKNHNTAWIYQGVIK